MTKAKSASTPDRIAELEDELKEKERRLQELKRELDEQRDLVQRQKEQLDDDDSLFEEWKHAFRMVQADDGVWEWSGHFHEAEEPWYDRYVGLARKWNRFVPEYNAIVRPRNIGRPLAASDAQRETVLKLHKAGHSLRDIAEEKNLGLRTVRTIVDQRDQRDRTSRKHLERIRRDMGEERAWQSRERARKELPRRLNAAQKQIAELRQEAKGLLKT